MDFCKTTLSLCLLAAVIGLAYAVEVQTTEDADATGRSCQGNNDYTVTDVASKAPIIGKLRRITNTDYGFIEGSYSQIAPFSDQNSYNNTWRIVCKTQKDVFAVVMSLHMKFDDYVQIKLKKITGEVGGKFESLHFSKRSVLVSVVSDHSRDVFAPQSSFLLGYMCISTSTDSLEKTADFLENAKVLEYMRCRPHSFVKLAEQLTQLTDTVRHFTSDDMDIQNMFRLKNDKESEVVPLPCTNTPVVMEWTESSADGMNIEP